MGGLIPTSADEFLEQQLGERLGQVERAFDSDALAISGALFDGVDDLIRAGIEHRQAVSTPRSRLVVILTTNGGAIETVHRIVDTLRHYYPEHVSFAIPNYAFSAGTVLAMSGDQIYMDYYSRLGPIDPQVRNDKGRMVPALGYLKKWEKLMDKAEKGKLTMVEAQLMTDGFDQAELYRYEQARELSITLLKEWLVKYKFKDWKMTETRRRVVTEKMRRSRAESIARILNDSDRWHSHGYGISMAVLQKDLNLRIDDLDTAPERCQAIKQYHGLLADYMAVRGHQNVINIMTQYRPYSIG